ncbi:phage terminase large subunit [Endozoicomonas ascidiicola]|uniref:phage terminase large subunit n=1 Tax=Endozoicomonas ascidiicola TaxID=1698521 RepID=UPI000832A2CA|nr:phage terminase large subunit [Endozoicomonas ascidiicola]
MSNTDVAQLALQEMAERELARKHLLPFIMRSNDHYMPGWVHKDICRRLEKFTQDVIDKKSPRLMLTQPPRSGKSEIVSRTFPAWFLGKYPDKELISTSYSGSLANDFSRKVRNLMREEQYQQLFPDAQLDPDTQAVSFWATLRGGSYLPAGVSGAISGRGSHIGLIDDPLKNREEAESEVVREAIWDWYTSTFYTRLAPGGGILLVMTRWHHDDLAGRLLEEMQNGGDQWELVEYPAIAVEDEPYRKKGEALHPERYDLTALQRIKRAVGPRDWQALYQQKPTADEGDYFTKQMIRTYRMKDLPARESLAFFTAWDLAVGTKQSNDWSVGITVAVDREDNIWVVDLFRKRCDAGTLVDEILDTWEIWRPEITGLEEGVIKHAIGPFLERRVQERNCYSFHAEPLKVGKSDKEARARSIQGRMKQGKVFLPEDAGFYPDLINELLQFPNGKHDDQVDALAHIGQLLMSLAQKRLPKATKEKGWRDRLASITRDVSLGSMAS